MASDAKLAEVKAAFPVSMFRKGDRRRVRQLWEMLAAMPRSVPVREELERLRLMAVYEHVPAARLAVAQGLIAQAARLRVQLDDLAEDIAAHGLTELFQQSEKQEPYTRERPASAIFVKFDKNYQTLMGKLDAMIPPPPESEEKKADKLSAFLDGGADG